MSLSQGLESFASGLGRDKGKQVDKRLKRHLSPNEEEFLLSSLKELIARGWKSDNGFRGGYLNKLEQLMKNKFPGTDLKGRPNLHSKIQTWKKCYNSLITMLSRSGIGFKDNMIDCTSEVWEEIIKTDANAKAMRHKSWPMFDDWNEIFGKDRATGDHAEDVVDAVNELMNQENRTLDDTPPDYYHLSLDELDDANSKGQNTAGSENGTCKDSVCGGETSETLTKGVGKRSKTRHDTDSIVEVLREMGCNMDAQIDALASRIGHEYDMDEEKKAIFSLLGEIPGLTLEDKFDICEIFAKNTDHILIFKGLRENTRPNYVERLLKSKPK